MAFATFKTDESRKYFQEGVEARQKGQTENTNPYTPGYHDYLEWDFGWETEDLIEKGA